MATVIIAVISAVAAVFASQGFWGFVTRKHEREKAEQKLLMGLAHDRIINLSAKYIHRGYITHEEYDDLNNYLYKPYKEKGGNGTADKMLAEVDKLPLKAASNLPKDKAGLYGFVDDDIEK